MRREIDKAVEFIKKNQRNDGGFWSFSSSEKDDFINAKKYNSIFPTALILECLNLIPNTDVVRKKAVDFLIKQKGEFWSFNYWARESEENKTMPYPDDLDDTFCTLSAIFNFDKKLIKGRDLAKIATILTAVEKKTGGPYKTWLVQKNANEAWHDVDVAVNSNIGYFLKLQEIELKGINKLIKNAIENEEIKSPYYPTIYPVAYFISRFFESEKLAEIILQKRKNGFWENPLNTALAISVLLNQKIDVEILKPSIEYLIEKQQKNGSWKIGAFCIDPAIDRKTYYAGSETLTTAFCVEALNKYYRENENKNKIKNEKDIVGEKIHDQILKNVKKKINRVGQIPKENCKTSITLLPYIFWKSLGKNGKKIDEKFLVKCGEANLLGWIAYTIYDDFLDDEGNKKLLPMANVCLRELSGIYNNILPKTDFDELFNEIMNGLDEANLWELNNCYDVEKIPDFGDYSQLAQKSLGHALGLVAILYKTGFGKNSNEVKNIFRFFKHYLIARQLNDDAHDWKNDLKRGFINPVVKEILVKTKDEKKFEDIFWKEVLIEISETILRNTEKARKEIRKIKIIEKPDLILSVLDNPEKSAIKAIEDQQNSLDFIDEYCR